MFSLRRNGRFLPENDACFYRGHFFLRKHLSHLMLYKCKIGLKVCYY